MTQYTIVQRLTLEISAKELTPEDQEKLVEELVRALEIAFEKLEKQITSKTGPIFRIEQIELDIGKISLGDWRERILSKVEDAIRKVEASNEGQVLTRLAKDETNRELLLHYLETASLPWWDPSDNKSIKQHEIKSLAEKLKEETWLGTWMDKANHDQKRRLFRLLRPESALRLVQKKHQLSPGQFKSILEIVKSGTTEEERVNQTIWLYENKKETWKEKETAPISDHGKINLGNASPVERQEHIFQKTNYNIGFLDEKTSTEINQWKLLGWKEVLSQAPVNALEQAFFLVLTQDKLPYGFSSLEREAQTMLILELLVSLHKHDKARTLQMLGLVFAEKRYRKKWLLGERSALKVLLLKTLFEPMAQELENWLQRARALSGWVREERLADRWLTIALEQIPDNQYLPTDKFIAAFAQLAGLSLAASSFLLAESPDRLETAVDLDVQEKCRDFLCTGRWHSDIPPWDAQQWNSFFSIGQEHVQKELREAFMHRNWTRFILQTVPELNLHHLFRAAYPLHSEIHLIALEIIQHSSKNYKHTALEIFFGANRLREHTPKNILESWQLSWGKHIPELAAQKLDEHIRKARQGEASWLRSLIEAGDWDSPLMPAVVWFDLLDRLLGCETNPNGPGSSFPKPMSRREQVANCLEKLRPLDPETIAALMERLHPESWDSQLLDMESIQNTKELLRLAQGVGQYRLMETLLASAEQMAGQNLSPASERKWWKIALKHPGRFDRVYFNNSIQNAYLFFEREGLTPTQAKDSVIAFKKLVINEMISDDIGVESPSSRPVSEKLKRLVSILFPEKLNFFERHMLYPVLYYFEWGSLDADNEIMSYSELETIVNQAIEHDEPLMRWLLEQAMETQGFADMFAGRSSEALKHKVWQLLNRNDNTLPFRFLHEIERLNTLDRKWANLFSFPRLLFFSSLFHHSATQNLNRNNLSKSWHDALSELVYSIGIEQNELHHYFSSLLMVSHWDKQKRQKRKQEYGPIGDWAVEFELFAKEQAKSFPEIWSFIQTEDAELNDCKKNFLALFFDAAEQAMPTKIVRCEWPLPHSSISEHAMWDSFRYRISNGKLPSWSASKSLSGLMVSLATITKASVKMAMSPFFKSWTNCVVAGQLLNASQIQQICIVFEKNHPRKKPNPDDKSIWTNHLFELASKFEPVASFGSACGHSKFESHEDMNIPENRDENIQTFDFEENNDWGMLENSINASSEANRGLIIPGDWAGSTGNELDQNLSQNANWTAFDKPDRRFYLRDAGVVLLWPHLATFFKRMGWMDEKHRFQSKSSESKAVHAVGFLATGQDDLDEGQLLLAKLLCGLTPGQGIELGLSFTSDELSEMDNLLRSVVASWKALKGTSPEGLRAGFFARQGILKPVGRNWGLKVDDQTIDLLLRKLPWGVGTIKLSWCDYLILTEWNY